MNATGLERPQCAPWLLRFSLAVMLVAVATCDTSAATYSALVSTAGADVAGCTSTSPGGGSSSPISADTACLGAGAGGATAFASFGHVGASANGLDFGTGGYSTAGSAFLIGDVLFTGVDPSAPAGTTHVTLNLNFGGTLSATRSAAAEVRASSSLFGNDIGSVLLLDAAGAFSCSSTFLGIGTCGSGVRGSISSRSILAPLNVSVQLALFLSVSAGGGDIGTSGSADFSNSLDFPIGSNVFGLPDGVTANGPDLDIFNNRFVAPSATPVPSSFLLLATGLAALGLLIGRRQRRREPISIYAPAC